jgi:hypothetical protein
LTQRRPGTTYEGKVVFADDSQISLQCYEDRVDECPGVLDNGYLCEGPCPADLGSDVEGRAFPGSRGSRYTPTPEPRALATGRERMLLAPYRPEGD